MRDAHQCAALRAVGSERARDLDQPWDQRMAVVAPPNQEQLDQGGLRQREGTHVDAVEAQARCGSRDYREAEAGPSARIAWICVKCCT